MAPELDDLLPSPRALFAHLSAASYPDLRKTLERLLGLGQGAHPAVAALAFGPDPTAGGHATQTLGRSLVRPEHMALVTVKPRQLVMNVEHGGGVMFTVVDSLGVADRPPLSAKQRDEQSRSLAAVEAALRAPRAAPEALALLPWLVAVARSESEVAGPARLVAEEVLGALLGDDAALVERLLVPERSSPTRRSPLPPLPRSGSR